MMLFEYDIIRILISLWMFKKKSRISLRDLKIVKKVLYSLNTHCCNLSCCIHRGHDRGNRRRRLCCIRRRRQSFSS